MFDAQLYRDKAEIEAWQQRGPIIGFTTRFKAAGLMDEEDYQRTLRECEAEVDAAVAAAQAAQWEPVSELARFVYAERGAS
jgi:TPP-dependent pyruvate/acetoin dehydrogenase alpha subunit